MKTITRPNNVTMRKATGEITREIQNTCPGTAAPPTLAAVAQAICLDATHDTMKYVLRSDTSHDGE